ncbi:alpha/beta fold hydrolase [Desulfobacterales bacterium HSG17]|nr:alpha/beta fold hydrolase [Desulfobacterales bacterium HSG17]
MEMFIKNVKLVFTIIMCFSLLNLFGHNAYGNEMDKKNEWVILLHGLTRSPGSMHKMAKQLEKNGYHVINQGYPSTRFAIETLAEKFIPKALEKCSTGNAARIHFVTHSMGGILVRYYLAHHDISNLGRVVMLSPPNHGTEAVDKLGWTTPFKWLNGPAGQQLGTGPESIPNILGPVNFDLGVITGDRSINWFLSCMIPGPDDGKVSLKSANIQGAADFLVLHATHPFIMKKKHVIRQTISFLQRGRFERKTKKKSS